MARFTPSAPIRPARTLIVGIQTPSNKTGNIDSYFEEFKNLVSSNGIEYDQAHFIKLRDIDPAHFLTKGKLEELIDLCKKHQIEEVVFSEQLSAQQERNLTDVLNAKVFDRTQLILEIFEKGAHSAEGKTQVALALLEHQKSRLAGKGKTMSQQQGSIGQRGPGETQKEVETQHIEHLMTRLRRELAHLRKVRATQRKQRVGSGIPHVCLVGYTNAGKSTILNALTNAGVLAEDRLFATLDTTTRELFLEGKKKGLISDTVGFIQQLPHNLVEAFKSTLEELQYAHLLLVVVDSSDKNWPLHIHVVNEVLGELGVTAPRLYVFNKSDRVADLEALEHATRSYDPHVIVHADSKEGLQTMIHWLLEWFDRQKQKGS